MELKNILMGRVSALQVARESALRNGLVLLLGMGVAIGVSGLSSARAAVEKIDPTRFEREVLVPAAFDPTSLEVARDGRVFFVERTGGFKVWDPQTRLTTSLGVIPTHAAWDTGLLALLLASDFVDSGFFYVLRCPEEKHLAMRVSRFRWQGGTLDVKTEVPILEWTIDSEEPPHCGGGLAWDGQGNLLIGSGDNTPPQDVPAMVSAAGKESFDARRSAGNSMDWRGKVLRVTPKREGGYALPAGNLFPEAGLGKPEIYAMGVRNPFRIAVDSKTGWIVVGDIGGNVEPRLGLGPEGYDEINVMRRPGFYGWPFMSGPNEAWRPFDPETKKPIGPPFDPAAVVNDSRLNSGLKQLPPAIPALLYYPTVASTVWPELGSGGRSITGGPIYRYDPSRVSQVQLPESFDGAILFAEYMRNWLKVIRLTPEGGLSRLEPFMAETVFRKPIDLKIGPSDGALYLAEYGDKFRDNRDGQITRVIYHRGNRAPLARVNVDNTAGPVPLKVALDATASSDPDGDSLKYEWKFSDGAVVLGSRVEHVFESKGRAYAELTVTDAHGAMGTVRTPIMAGNTRPVLRFQEPQDGGFLDDASSLGWQLGVTDAEDGSLQADRVLVQVERRDKAGGQEGKRLHPGLALMRSGTCFACHSATEKSAGPPYLEVSRRYAQDEAAREKLAAKIVSGGVGVWGPVPMPPHPQHTVEQTRQMVDWILSLSVRKSLTLPAGLSGKLNPGLLFDEPAPAREGILYFTAMASDLGVGDVPPLRGETSMVIRTRRQRAAHFDFGQKASYQENLGDGLVARVEADGWIGFERIRLNGLKEIKLRARGWKQQKGRVEIRLDGPEGKQVGMMELAAQGSEGGMQKLSCELEPSEGVHSVVLRVVSPGAGPVVGETIEMGVMEFR